MVDIDRVVAELVGERGLADVLRAVSRACDAQAELVYGERVVIPAADEDRAQVLVRVGIDVAMLADDVEEVLAAASEREAA